jgi:hypothetical protein
MQIHEVGNCRINFQFEKIEDDRYCYSESSKSDIYLKYITGVKPLIAKLVIMYLRAILCTFQISVDFLLCTCGWERRGERGAGEGEGARERGIECILYGYTQGVLDRMEGNTSTLTEIS